ncbi:MAG TPA: DUF6580 family putative transport protein [Burkholderiales bacterium]|nr:DUF6580 family putative transport protein [Burkholderiales bacterium]
MKQGLVIALIVMALAGRLVPHPDNFTPVLAVALFGGAMLPGAGAFLVPVAALFLSDLALGNSLGWMTVVIYGAFLAGAGIGRWLGPRRTWTRTAFAAVGGSLLFYVVTNFAVWALPGGHAPLYPATLAGLAESYWMGLPFLRNGLAGDLFWTAVLFGVFDLARSRAGRATA